MEQIMENLRYIFVMGVMIGALAMLGDNAQAQQGSPSAEQNPVTAIDIALGASHQPHITILQRYVRTADLDKAYAAASKILASDNVTSMKLKAYKY